MREKIELMLSNDGVFNELNLNKEPFIDRLEEWALSRGNLTEKTLRNKMILTALENVSRLEPDWDKVAVRLKLAEVYEEACYSRGGDPHITNYPPFASVIKKLTAEGIYSSELSGEYHPSEIVNFGMHIRPHLDDLFTYAGLTMMLDRYCAKDKDGLICELPQERFMTVAMDLMRNEPLDKREGRVLELYWALSNLYMTVATPTLANAGKSYGQYSSCFIDTVDDSLRGIMDSNTDFSLVSKSGGGMGLYMGKVRSLGSSIRGIKGASGGVVPWIKQANNTAVSVDQLGKRQGAVTVYLDVWHKDIFPFLELKLNNGDERKRAHDIFTGVCIPDLFMEQVQARGEWHLFDPHEFRQVMGANLEDHFDEEKRNGSFRELYWKAVENPLLQRETVKAIDVMKAIMRSQLETGTPFMFYRDTVNRLNPNAHGGIIYCSNLCTEILQNNSATRVVEEMVTQEYDKRFLVTRKEMGDFVVCNLASINLGRAVPDGVILRLVPIMVRALDNVITLNEDRIEVKQAVETNRKYRAIGLGTFGLHHLLALEGIRWESDDAVAYNNKLYERINFYAIEASAELARERGSYPLFNGSDWNTGRYFEKRGYSSEVWKLLKDKASRGMRNGYIMAVAPNGSTSVIAGSTASVDPIFKQEYAEEKKGMKVVIVAPDLNPKTNFFYKSAYHIDQHWSIEQNAARQRHVDQSISFNLYVPETIKAKDLLALHEHAWEAGLKTTYYTRSESQEAIDECESCQ
ncbi:Ribonucleoside-diphosphate reductase 2 subunit alpha [Bacillus paralicheniformis]|uniref:ribonucleoside-diphosphate reductase subunit alpha n=1 Tax=Bacillus paralicheniformis TaxID=1648923 RepID=UPI00119EA411|nr:ribonucleoside-diphosphate reductase subunit alpha [Bacillus paralicheniformis]TWJ39632.1 Ribonucleoside-diphosphate reductase 2 subunit alpha [Bacillus paralicheniformis]